MTLRKGGHSHLKEEALDRTMWRSRFVVTETTKLKKKIRPWEPSCSMRTDGRTDMTKLIFPLCNFANESKNEVELGGPENFHV